MKNAALLSLFILVAALPMLADDERHQSYLSYEEGGTVVRSGEDGRDVEAHRNLPVYPGDEVITARRGRAEVRLSDGNIIGIDRATSLRFRSMRDAFEGDANETIVELRQGKVAVHRTDIGRDHVRLDTEHASYVAEYEAVYSVETDPRGSDRVTVFDGSVEVRTPSRTTRLREGESADVDNRGAYDLVGDQRSSADDFERWFLRRAERFGSYTNRYMDRRLSYWSDDLDDNGRWVFVTGIGWSWRPYVAVGWRPYYNGYWYNRAGCLTWVSYDPWGWGTHHYGRWAYDPGYGWVWVPGYGYSPAWVYWAYGSGYVGWAPAGWWDCHRSYYSWAYHPYRYTPARWGFGFYGRVNARELDLRPWTFVEPNAIVSNRVDRAALTTDAIKQRLGRSRDGMTTIASGAHRFTREEWNDPADAIRRRGLDGRRTGAETGAPPTDITPFVRRDGEVPGVVRDRIARGRGTPDRGTSTATRGGTIGGGSVAPIGSGALAPIGRGNVAPISPGSATDGRRGGDTNSGRVGRGSGGSVAPPASSPTGSRDTDRSGSWRGRDRDADTGTPASGGERRGGSDTWRSRVPRSGDGDTAAPPSSTPSSGSSAGSGSSSDVPRRVIDRIGGVRVYPRDSGESTRDRGSRSSGGSSSTRERGSRDSGSSSRGSSTRERSSGRSGGSGDGGSRASSPPPPPPPPPSSSGNSGGSSSRGSSDGGGRVSRDRDQ
jgi:hypothetical protein